MAGQSKHVNRQKAGQAECRYHCSSNATFKWVRNQCWVDSLLQMPCLCSGGSEVMCEEQLVTKSVNEALEALRTGIPYSVLVSLRWDVEIT